MKRSLKNQKVANAQPVGWNPDPDDPNMVRNWNGYRTTQPMSVQMALLEELFDLNKKTEGIVKLLVFILFVILFVILISFVGGVATILLVFLSSAP
jgi:hypothetical protein